MKDDELSRERATPDRAGMEQGPADPTRKLLKVFGVKVTDYEAKTDALLQRSSASDADRVAVLNEALELTADLDHWLREVTSHVLERQERVLTRLRQG